MKPIGRSTFRMIFWRTLVGIALLFVLSKMLLSGGRQPSDPLDHPLQTTLAWSFCVWLLLGRLIAYLLVPLIVSTISCPGCRRNSMQWECGIALVGTIPTVNATSWPAGVPCAASRPGT